MSYTFLPSVLADADSSAVREAVAGLASLSENIQSKTEQVSSPLQLLPKP